MPGKPASTCYFGTVDGEASTSISGLSQKTLFAISTIFSAPRGKQQELCCWPCMSEYSLLEESHSLSAACLRPSGFMAHNQTLHGALRDTRGPPSKQCTHLPTGAGYPWDESIACPFALCQRHGRITAGAALVGEKGCKFMAEIKLLNSS